ncbi:MAG: 50S ribosomal protein L11 methyltransferase [Solirubrobacteraceae bacterium]
MIRLAVRVAREQSEIVLAELLELAPGGVEEVDVDGAVVEYAVYGPPGELPALPDLRAAAGTALVEVITTEIADDWADRWREFHRPLVLGERLTVRPPWEPPAAAGIDLVIDPAQAFGTGAHATTRLCLELLLELAPPRIGGASCSAPGAVDLGCGSGVLAIAAAKLGWGPVLALDFDPLSVGATSANAIANGVAHLIGVRRFDLRGEIVPAAALVLANLLAPLLLTWCQQLAEGAEAPGTVIASGLLGNEADAIAGAFARAGLQERGRRGSGDWAALLLVRGS